ncbi:MAG: hypothetical protein ACKV2T_26715 [Kofleriaceae bacterium]
MNTKNDNDGNDPADDRMIAHALGAWTPMEPPVDFADRVLAARAPLAPSVARSKRAWWLAAPVLAVAMIALVFFFSTQVMHDTAMPSTTQGGPGAGNAQMVAIDHITAGSGMGSGSIDTVAMGSATIAMNQPSFDAGVATQLPPMVDEPETDLAVIAGTSVTIHDPAPSNDREVLLHVEFAALCPIGAEVSVLDPSGVIPSAFGRTRARLMLHTGSWKYEVRCVPDRSTVAATGTIRVVVDAANRRLPKLARTVTTIETDGRTWRVSSAVVPPEIRVKAPGATRVHYATGGIEKSVPVIAGVATIVGVDEGTYTYWAVTPSGVGTTSTLIVDFDHTSPQLYLGSIRTTQGAIVVDGAVLPGWTLAIGGEPITLRKNLTFQATVRGFGRAVIRAEHPTLGVHYFATLPITR